MSGQKPSRRTPWGRVAFALVVVPLWLHMLAPAAVEAAGVGKIESVARNLISRLFGGPVRVTSSPTNGQVLQYSTTTNTWAAATSAAPTLETVLQAGNTMGSERFLAANGTAADPVYSFENSTGAGLFREAGNAFSLSSGGTTAMTIGGQVAFEKSVYGLRSFTEARTISGAISAGINNSFQTFNNTGSGGTITLTLPAATTAALSGSRLTFVRTASQILRIDVDGTDTFVYSGGTSAAGKYLELGSDGAAIVVLGTGLSSWTVLSEVGTVTIEP